MTSQDISTAIVNAATAYGVDPRLALEVAMTESGLNEAAVSSAGAIGIFQLMPATASDLGVDPTDPTQNIDGGVRYLAQLLSQFAGDTSKALAAYNWGPSNVLAAVAQWGANWLANAPSETQNYVNSILASIGTLYSVSASAPIGSSVTASSLGITSLGTVGWIVGAVVVGWLLWETLQ